ncbi:hypothetical protein L208DRAFT_469172 [Tricholoma matsutake]|nr:hypothetical protein L208DRAFT_469172 [Tricholoma matsutake 945]
MLVLSYQVYNKQYIVIIPLTEVLIISARCSSVPPFYTPCLLFVPFYSLLHIIHIYIYMIVTLTPQSLVQRLR